MIFLFLSLLLLAPAAEAWYYPTYPVQCPINWGISHRVVGVYSPSNPAVTSHYGYWAINYGANVSPFTIQPTYVTTGEQAYVNHGDYILVQCGYADGYYTKANLKAFRCDDYTSLAQVTCNSASDYLYADHVNVILPQAASPTYSYHRCVAMGGSSGVIRSEFDNVLLAKTMSIQGSYTFASSDCVFIGFSDVLAEGVWRWADHTPITYTNWAAAEEGDHLHPADGGSEHDAEDSAVMCRSEGWKWVDVGYGSEKLALNLFTGLVDSAFGSCTLRNLEIGSQAGSSYGSYGG